MKTNLPPRGSTNAQQAQARAQIANDAASSAREKRGTRNRIRQSLDDIALFFLNSPVALATGVFLSADLMEVVFSWPMYNDLMSQMTGRPNDLLALLGATFVILWGAYASHLIGKKMDRALIDYDVYNEMKQSNIPLAAAMEKVKVSTRRDLFVGVILAIALLIVVAAVSWQRVWLQSTITGSDYSLLHKLLPVVCVLVEIMSGIYIGYLLRRITLVFKRWGKNRRYRYWKRICSYETTMCNEYYRYAIANGESINWSKDLSDAIYRYEHRSHDDENYIDKVELKTLTVLVRNKAQNAQPGIHLAAKLSDGAHCNSVITNVQGEGTLSWDSAASEVTAVYANNKQFKGPFRENSSIAITV